MPKHEKVKHSGTIGDVFGHRFVLKLKKGSILADIGPNGLEHFRLKTGYKIQLEGEETPTEVKVHSISRDHGKVVVIDNHKPQKEHETADPQEAISAARKAGFEIIGEPRRKPKHFEIHAQNSNGTTVELHVEFDGHIRKKKKLQAA